jgi:hypothetical protein
MVSATTEISSHDPPTEGGPAIIYAKGVSYGSSLYSFFYFSPGQGFQIGPFCHASDHIEVDLQPNSTLIINGQRYNVTIPIGIDVIQYTGLAPWNGIWMIKALLDGGVDNAPFKIHLLGYCKSYIIQHV